MKENFRKTARDTALEVLLSVSAANAWSDGSLKRTIAKMVSITVMPLSAAASPTVSSRIVRTSITISTCGALNLPASWNRSF